MQKKYNKTAPCGGWKKKREENSKLNVLDSVHQCDDTKVIRYSETGERKCQFAIPGRKLDVSSSIRGHPLLFFLIALILERNDMLARFVSCPVSLFLQTFSRKLHENFMKARAFACRTMTFLKLARRPSENTDILPGIFIRAGEAPRLCGLLQRQPLLLYPELPLLVLIFVARINSPSLSLFRTSFVFSVLILRRCTFSSQLNDLKTS